MKLSLYFEREEFVKQAVKDEFGYLLDVALFTVDLSNKKVLKLAHLVVYCVVNAIALPVSIWATIALRSDLFYFSQSLHYTLLAALALIVTVNLNYGNEHFHKFHSMWATGFFDYGERPRVAFDQLKRRILLERKLLNLLPLFVLLIGMILFVAKFMDEWMGVASGTYVNGINVRLTVPFWTPFDSRDGFAFYATTFFLLIEAFFTVTAIASAGFMYAVGSQRVLLQLKMLRWSIQHIEDRAKELSASSDESVSLEQCLVVCLKKNIAHYQRIRSYHVVFTSNLASNIVFCAFIVGTVVIALSMVILKEEESLTLGNTLSFVSLGVTEVANMFLVCGYGERISSECENLFDDLYFVSWYNYGDQFEKLLAAFKSQTRQPMTFKAGGFADVNLKTFTSIMKTAYSYFNLLNARKRNNP